MGDFIDFETVFKCLLKVADQRAEAKKPPKMQFIGCNVGRSSEEDDNNDSSAAAPVPKGRGGGKRSKTIAHLHGGGGGGGEGAAVKAEEPIELLNSS